MELAAPGARPRRGHLDRMVVRGVGCAVLALAAAGSAAAITAAAGEPGLAALARGVIVGVPIAAGLGAAIRMENDRFGLLLAGLGALLLLSTLAESGDAVPYTIGRMTGWLVELALVYLILSFPSGRLASPTDRALFGAGVLIVLALFLPRLALSEHFDIPTPYTSCTQDCPANALFALDSEPGFAYSVLRPAGGLMFVALSVAVLWRLRERAREATALARRLLLPVLIVGTARMGLLGVGFVARQADHGAVPVQITAWSLALSAPAIAIAFLFAILRRELYAGRALERLAEWVPAVPDRTTLRRVLAEAFDDPTLQIALPADGPEVPKPGPGQTVTEVRDDGRVVAVVTHDAALRASPRVLDAGLGLVGIVLENQRLTAEAETATLEVGRSRARIAASAERERRRIERDLHDGAQQRLVAIRIELELAEELVQRDPAAGVARLRELEDEVDEALEELRSLAHGVYPPLLADRGLAEALETVAARSAIAVEVEASAIGRYVPEVESAVYFCVLEALQNVLKHAVGARRVAVRLDGANRTELRFSVRDDGEGAGPGGIRAGDGITNMRDRLAAVGGEVAVTSMRAVGTTVRGRVPTRQTD
jgi:signal transduction histidine kinase